ncbi:M28 family peptidase [Arenibacter sp. GZD96]|uniref:M20/M25/M40 family metallo-hydrolase n=1 Tax=Aurantibrevibacter litoralis TaxID=3106030 RepID=UPI002AFE9112|nr:M20/M25/M40 family metallo-hydrolase [Arenibacter sp. GZD-96]MEA1787200.1 M28 family peptidase [Arenibacter sp. GZD-96]
MIQRRLFICFLFVLVACKKERPTSVTLNDDVTFLASDALKGRETGTESELMAANYIQKRMQSMGLQPKGMAGTYFQTFTFKPKKDPHSEVHYGNGDSTITGTNVIGFIDHKAENTIVIGAHYDHLGMGGEGSLHREGQAIHNGADDNASGVAVLLQLAEKLKQIPARHNYLFLAFSGEEMGLLGSNYFVKNPTINLSKVNCMLNMDMVGRLREDITLSISGTGTATLWEQIVQTTNPGFKLVLQQSGVGPSDHTSFYLQDIPVLHFFTGQHEDYHKPSDDSEKLNYEGMQLLTDYITAILMEVDQAPKLAFRKTKNESEEVPRFKVGLGVVPDYLFDGKGMRIDGVSEDKPAQKAGLQKGDIVLQLGDSIVVNMMSYMRALSAFKEGDKTKVIVDRNGSALEVDIAF